MLVYMRVEDMPQILFRIKSKHIPLHLHQRFASDQNAIEKKEKEHNEAYLCK